MNILKSQYNVCSVKSFLMAEFPPSHTSLTHPVPQIHLPTLFLKRCIIIIPTPHTTHLVPQPARLLQAVLGQCVVLGAEQEAVRRLHEATLARCPGRLQPAPPDLRVQRRRVCGHSAAAYASNSTNGCRGIGICRVRCGGRCESQQSAPEI